MITPQAGRAKDRFTTMWCRAVDLSVEGPVS